MFTARMPTFIYRSANLCILFRYEAKCQESTQKLAQVAKNLEGAIRVCRVNIDEYPDVASGLGVRTSDLPAFFTMYGMIIGAPYM